MVWINAAVRAIGNQPRTARGLTRGLWAQATGQPAAYAAGYAACALLDGLDGALARRLGQASAYGAFLDVAVDNISRSALWSLALPGTGRAL